MIKRVYWFFLKILISLSIIYFFFKKVGINEYIKELRSVDIGLFVLGFSLYMVGLFVFTYKWRILLQMMGINAKFFDLIRANLSSMFYSLFLPGGFLVGETIKCYQISKGKEQKSKFILSVIVDRLSGIVSFIFIGYFFYLIVWRGEKDILFFYSLFFLGAVLLCVLFASRAIRSFIWKLSLPGLAGIRRIFSKQELIKNRPIIWAILAGMFFQLVITLGLMFLVKAQGYEVSYWNLVWINSLLSVITMIPVTVMGIGLREMSLIYFLGGFGIPPEACLSIATLMVAVFVLRGLVGGVLELKKFFI